jgi:hypothetical protein
MPYQFPTTPVPTTNLATGSANPAAARSDLLTLVNAFNTLLQGLGVAGGYAQIDANGNVILGSGLNFGVNSTSGFPRLTLSANAYIEWNTTTNTMNYYLSGVLKGSMPMATPATNNYNDLLNLPTLQTRNTSYLTYGGGAATVNLDFMANCIDYRLLVSISGTITFTTSNKALGRAMTILLWSDASARTLTFPSSWTWVGTKPTATTGGKCGILSITCFGANETDVYAAYGQQY